MDYESEGRTFESFRARQQFTAKKQAKAGLEMIRLFRASNHPVSTGAEIAPKFV
jgi:hypothetical protein